MNDNRPEDFVSLLNRVRSLVNEHIVPLADVAGDESPLDVLRPGKMLRSRLGARLAETIRPPEMDRLAHALAAVELAHTATLCHDDVIDLAALRRGKESLWKAVGPARAIMVGDWLLCESLNLADATNDRGLNAAFLAKIQETCRAEARHEMVLRGEPMDPEEVVRLARGRTGSFFAFAAMAAGGDVPFRRAAFESAGYHVGTAYQLADDLLDALGSEAAAGKTLGTDKQRGKGLLAQCPAVTPSDVCRMIAAELRSAQSVLVSDPSALRALDTFVTADLFTAIREAGLRMPIAYTNARGGIRQ